MNIRQYLGGTQGRTQKAKLNIAISVALKAIDMAVYLFLVPVTIGYLNAYEYGIWLTLSSILVWINTFDIGLGNGLRNKLAIAVANNDNALGKSYVSSTVVMLLLIVAVIGVFGVSLISVIEWYGLLNTTQDLVPNLSNIVSSTFVLFCINFLMKFIGNVYQGMQMPSISTGMNVVGHLLSLIIIYILTLTTSGNLLYVAITYSISPTIIYFIAYPITFGIIYKQFSPSLKFFKWTYVKDLCSLSVRFFILQIAGLVIFSMTNLLISNMFGPEEVTPYNLSYRYFSIANMVLSLILAPIWSATTDAYVRKDMEWIKRSIKKVKAINVLATLALGMMLLLSPIVYKIWVGDSVSIPFTLSCLMAVYIDLLIWSLCYSSFLNGMGALKIQTINSMLMAILFLPICYLLGNQYGINGILLGMIIVNLPGLIFNVIQFNKIINSKGSKIWYI